MVMSQDSRDVRFGLRAVRLMSFSGVVLYLEDLLGESLYYPFLGFCGRELSFSIFPGPFLVRYLSSHGLGVIWSTIFFNERVSSLLGWSPSKE